MADLLNEVGVPLVNAQTNQVETVPHDTANQALLSGSHNLQAGQSINVVNPDGALVSLPSEQIPSALQSGYKLPGQADIVEHNNQTQYGEGLAPEVESAAAAAARTATFGGSDVALTKTGLVAPNTLKQLQERNPLANFTGDVAGIAGSIAGLGALSPVGAAAALGEGVTEAASPVAAAIAKSLAAPETSPIVAKILASVGNVGAKTLGSAVEGSVYGLGNAVSENALGDANLNAENILHNVGYGALFGGALGGALGLTSETYKGLKATFGKDVAQAATKDAIIENGALAPHSQDMNPPTSIEEIAQRIKDAKSGGFGEELPAKSRLLETQDVLAGDSNFPAHQYQIQSLTSPVLRDQYKTLLENPLSEDGQTMRAYESVQKMEGSQKLLPKFIQNIAPESIITGDAVQGGNQAIKAFTDQYQQEQTTLKPFFKDFDKQAVTLAADPSAVLTKIDQAIPEAQKFIVKDPEGYGISPYEKTMPFSKDTHEAIKSLLDALNKPEGVTIADLRNVREAMRDNVNFLTAPRTSAQISSLRKSIMDLMQDEVQKNAPQMETVEGLHNLQSPLHDPRELFKRYAMNEENRSVIEQIFGGSISDKATFAREIKPEEVLNRVFSNTASVKAAKEILGSDFDKIAANYLKKEVERVTDSTKNGFSSNKFATLLKQKAPELEEALREHPEQLNKIRAVTDKMRILPDSPSVNPSGTAKTNLLQKVQNMTGYLTSDGLLSIPGKVMGKLGEAYGEMQQHSELNRILRSNSDMGSEEQLAKKTAQYGAFAKIERMAQTTASKISSGVDALFKPAETLKGAVVLSQIPKEKQQANYEKMRAHLSDMTGNPNNMVDKMAEATQSLHEVAPDINASLNMATTRATQFLASKLPQMGQSSPLTEPYQPSQTELSKFNRYVHIVEHPLDTLKQLQNGHLTTETLETMQTVYPKLLNQMQQAAMQKLNEKNVAKMSYQSKIMLSAFLGEDLDNSLKQPNIAAAQIAGVQPPPPPPPMQKKQKVNPSQKGLGKLDRSTSVMTDQQQSSQRIES